MDFIETGAIRQLRHELKAGRHVLVTGGYGAGKTSALRLVTHELSTDGHLVGYVSAYRMEASANPLAELALSVLDAASRALPSAKLGIATDLRSEILEQRVSDPLFSMIAIMREVLAELPEEHRIYLVFDDLDRTRDPRRVVEAIERLVQSIPRRLTVVLAARLAFFPQLEKLGALRAFTRIELRFSREDARRLLEAAGWSRSALEREASNEELNAVVTLVQNSPFLARAVASGLDELDRRPSVERLLDLALERFSEREGHALLQIALGSPSGVEISRLESREGHQGLPQQLVEKGVAVWSRDRETIALAHVTVREAVLRRAGLDLDFDPGGLDFGAEEAENDGALATSLVPHPGFEALSTGTKSIVVGDRGSGKSALVRILMGSLESAGHEAGAPVHESSQRRTSELKNPAEFFEAVTASSAGSSSADRTKATWLALIATKVATHLLASSQDEMPAKLRKDCHSILRHFGYKDLSAQHLSRLRRGALFLAGFVKRHVRVKAGPVLIEPAGSDPSKGGRELDVLAFLTRANDWLTAATDPLVVIADHIDEVRKYDRAAQEAVVQGLFLAESALVPLKAVQLVVMIRTDLYEVYDLQEKNKIVSRTVHLQWPDEEVLLLLANRLLGNKAIAQIAKQLNLEPTRRPEDLLRLLELCFPDEVEGERFQTWLLEGLRNGHDRIAPRSIVLFLNAARDQAVRFGDHGAGFPLFSLPAVSSGMNDLSRLSYDEVVSDFRVSVNFVRNCRAHRLEQFELEEVQQLFSLDEGPVNRQVEILERLGFLRRVAQRDDDGVLSTTFRIPRLYARSWTTFAPLAI